jgi:hypothetical protein
MPVKMALHVDNIVTTMIGTVSVAITDTADDRPIESKTVIM